MNFNNYLHLRDKHAFLSASNYHWVNYSEEKLAEVFTNNSAKQRGSELHQLAHDLIKLNTKLPRSQKTLNMYVNDAIGFKMQPEQILYYSDNCFGTADAISFRKKLLRIHDLKTGIHKASMKQLEVYAALFCLEYNHKPSEINIELRIYQNNECVIHESEVEEIERIMKKIYEFDKQIEFMKGNLA